MKVDFGFVLAGICLGLFVSILIVHFFLTPDFQLAFNLCVETYEESVFVNTLFYSQINNLTFNASQTKEGIMFSNIRQQFLDKVVED